jgi:hypothetical protein
VFGRQTIKSYENENIWGKILQKYKSRFSNRTIRCLRNKYATLQTGGNLKFYEDLVKKHSDLIGAMIEKNVRQGQISRKLFDLEKLNS